MDESVKSVIDPRQIAGYYAFAYRNDDGTYYAPLVHRCETLDDVEWLKSMHQETVDACKKQLHEENNEKKQAVIKVHLELLESQEFVVMSNTPCFSFFDSNLIFESKGE